MSEFIYKSAIELADLIRNKNATSRQIVSDHLAQIEKHNGSLNAVIISMKQEALQTADLCDQEAADGKFRGPLHGVPMTIKEQFWVKGTKSTVNSNMHKDWVAPEDAVIVDRLKKAGAVILGKTNIPKNLTDYQVSGDIYPEGKNPYNTEYSPGGSSGGSSAALASGMVPIELGGDFGGSVRVPSNYCGLYGLKLTENTTPGHGMVPQPKGARGAIFHMAGPGPMARDIDDMELVWKIIRGPHACDRNTPRIDWQEPEERSLSDLKIAWVDGWPGYEASSQTRSVIKRFVDQLAKNNSRTENIGPPDDLHRRSLAIWVRMFPQLIGQDVPWFIRPLMKMEIKKTLLKGMNEFHGELDKGFKHSLINYSESMGVKAGITREWEGFFENHDLLICPMSFGPAYRRCKLGTPIEYDGKKLAYINYVWPYVACFNASGNPAINIPLGIGKEGLPVGVQVVGAYWSEPLLIRFAKLVSGFTDGFVKPDGY